jgi:hypothetical protein
MREQSQNAARATDLIRGCISGLGAMLIMSYVATVSKPGIMDAFVSLISVGAVVGACLCFARASVEPKWTAVVIIGGAGICLLNLRFLS